MNLKLNNDVRGSVSLLPNNKTTTSIKEERRRTGRYIAILVGIALFLLAIYHAWVRRIPIVASLVVPALIMFVYVGWVLYTASKDKHKLQDAEAAYAAMNAASPEGIENEGSTFELANNNMDISIISSKDSSKHGSPETKHKNWTEVSSTILKSHVNSTLRIEQKNLVKPIILVNDKLPEDEKWIEIVQSLVNNDKLKGFQNRRKYKRKFCRSKRHAVFKRSYSIA